MPNILAPLMHTFGIKSTRLCLEADFNNFANNYSSLLPSSSLNFYSSIIKDSRVAYNIYAKNKIFSSHFFIGLSTMGKNLNFTELQIIIDKIKSELNDDNYESNTYNCNNIFIELMVHCGYKCQEDNLIADDFSKSDERVHELNVIYFNHFKVLTFSY